MAATHLKLHPGEEIRTPRILGMFWKGDRTRGNNLLRRFLLTHHRPQPDGKPLVLPVLVGIMGGFPAAEHLKTIQHIIRHDLPIGLYWIDAEWYGQAPWFKSNGNWEVRKDLYPQGFRALSEPLAKQASPINYVSKDAPPFLIMHGDRDTTIPISQGKALFEGFKKAGASVAFEPLKGVGHPINSPDRRKTVFDFFDEVFKVKK